MGGLWIIILLVILLWALVANRRYRRMRGWGYTGGFWPIFWFGRRRYNDWYRQFGPGPGANVHPGPGYEPRGYDRPSRPRNPGGNRPGPGPGSSRPYGGSRPSGGGSFGGSHGGGFGGHGGGGGGGRH